MDLFTKVHEVYVKDFASVIHASKLKRGAHVPLVTFIIIENGFSISMSIILLPLFSSVSWIVSLAALLFFLYRKMGLSNDTKCLGKSQIFPSAWKIISSNKTAAYSFPFLVCVQLYSCQICLGCSPFSVLFLSLTLDIFSKLTSSLGIL